MTTTIHHTGLTHLFTEVCNDKTDWDINPILYVIERERDDTSAYYLTPLSILSEDMLHIAEATKMPFPVILERYADVMEFTHELAPDLNPAGKHLEFIGMAFTCEAFKTNCDPETGKPIGQPDHSDDPADNPNSVEIFSVAAYTIDNMIHGHTIERDTRDHEHYCETMTEKHEIARVPNTLRRMVNVFHNASTIRETT